MDYCYEIDLFVFYLIGYLIIFLSLEIDYF